MKNTLLPLLTVILITTTLPTLGKSVVREDVRTLKEVARTIDQEVRSNPGNILVVFDIDDTLLESSRFFGGDTWYNWQRGKEIKHKNGSPVVIDEADKITCMFSKLGTLYELGLYHATEKDAAGLVKTLQDRFDVIALTSRSPDYRAGTRRELARAGFEFERDHLMPKEEALAYSFDDGRSTRPITFQQGIIMSTGLNKGKVLEDLLHRVNTEYSAIYFVDDSWDNIMNMHKAWQDKATAVTSFHYTGVDKTVNNQMLEEARVSRQTFNTFLQTAYPTRYQAFQKGSCQ